DCLAMNLLSELYIYIKDGFAIMSDSYNAYMMYEELDFQQVPCIVIGKTPRTRGVKYIDKPFVHPRPSKDLFKELSDNVNDLLP
ncbi:MAG: hypothetical protein ABIS59_00375, partial [Candidatus Saccharibacteria bacterium]